jgi:hypothetical protein
LRVAAEPCSNEDSSLAEFSSVPEGTANLLDVHPIWERIHQLRPGNEFYDNWMSVRRFPKSTLLFAAYTDVSA